MLVSHARYQLPGRVEAYPGVINFIAYELIAAILWKIMKHQLKISYEDLMSEASRVYEVEFTSKNRKKPKIGLKGKSQIGLLP